MGPNPLDRHLGEVPGVSGLTTRLHPQLSATVPHWAFVFDSPRPGDKWPDLLVDSTRGRVTTHKQSPRADASEHVVESGRSPDQSPNERGK